MLKRYGKIVDMRNINRNLGTVREIMEEATGCMNEYYHVSKEGKPRCRICGSNEVTLFVKLLGKYDYYSCSRCESLFLGDIPDVKSMYNGGTANSTSYIDDTVYDKRVEMIAAPKIQFVLEACREDGDIQLESWLDIGCGGGEILNWLSCNSNIRAEGIESDEREYRFTVSKGLNVNNCYIDIENENDQINQMIYRNDVISFFNVLEHMENPVGFINYVHENMHNNAVLVFEVPRHPSVASFANMTCSEMVYRHISSPGHLQVFSEKAIDMLFENKFRMIGKWVFGQGYTDLINNAMLMAEKEESTLYNKLLDVSNRIQAIFDEEGMADQILVVAVKE